jgi:hypothetical protein
MDNYYSLLLKEYVRNSGMSLSEIEAEMRKRGFKRNKAYLSNLQNGKVSPPPFEETRELCNVIGGDSIRLGLTGVLMEISAPEFFISMTDTITTMIATLLDMNKVALKKELVKFYINDFPFDEVEGFKELLEEIKDNDEIEKIKEDIILANDLEQYLNFNAVKHVLDEEINKYPWREMLITALREAIINKREDSIENVVELIDFQFNHGISLKEAEYLKECLNVYRKLNLKPCKG